MNVLATAPFLAWAGNLVAGAVRQPMGSFSQISMRPSPQYPTTVPSTMGQLPGNASQFPPTRIDPHAVLEQNQKNIRKDVARLYDLAGKLRKQVDHTDSSEVLSIDLIHTADEIEKLAKHIKDLAHG